MNPLVTPTWLAAHLQNPNTIILDATLPPVGVTPPIDTHARYLNKHIPGALFFDIEELSDHSTPKCIVCVDDDYFVRRVEQRTRFSREYRTDGSPICCGERDMRLSIAFWLIDNFDGIKF